jgi:hypothetical protein
LHKPTRPQAHPHSTREARPARSRARNGSLPVSPTPPLEPDEDLKIEPIDDEDLDLAARHVLRGAAGERRVPPGLCRSRGLGTPAAHPWTVPTRRPTGSIPLKAPPLMRAVEFQT